MAAVIEEVLHYFETKVIEIETSNYNRLSGEIQIY